MSHSCRSQVQPALYNGHILVMSNHARPVVHDSEDTREISETTRKRMLEKMKSPQCVENKVRIAPPDYSKENLLATFAPQRNLTPEQIFWSIDNNDRKKAETSVPKPLSALTVYPPNTPVKLVPRVLPTKSVTEGERGFEQTKRCYLTEVIPFFKTLKEHFAGVQTALFKEVKVMEEIFDQMSDEVDQNTVDKQCAEIERKNLLIANENLIANCLSNQLLYDVEKSRCLDLETEMSKVQNEIKHVSKLEREYLNLQLKYQHLQESFDNNKSQTSQDVPEFNSFFKINNLENQIQEKDNVIRDLKVLVSNVNDRSCEPYNANDVTALIEQNECVRVELEEVKQHYKELFESIQITRASTNEKTSSLLTQIEDLKAQLEGNLKVAARSSVKTKVLAPGMYAIDVEPIPPRLKNNRNAHLTYFQHLKESVKILGRFSVNATPTVKIVLNKGKQIWKPKGKLSDNSLNKTKQIWQPKGKLFDNSLKKTKQVWKATGKLFANVGYQWRPTGKKFTSGKLNCGYQWRPTGKKFALGELCPLTRLPVTCTTVSLTQQTPPNWGSEIPNPPNSTVFKCRWYRSSFGLAPSHVPATTNIPPTDKDLEILFQPMFDEYFEQSTDSEPVPTATVVNAPIVSTNTSVSTTIAQDAPSTTGPTIEDTSITQADLHPSVNPVEGEPSSAQSTSGDVSLAEPHQVNQPPDHLRKWSRDHPLDNIVGNPSRLSLLTASADVPSGVIETTDTTSTLPPPPPPLQKPTGSFKDGDGDGDTHYERSHKGVKASANSDIIFFFTSAQDGNKLLDDERLSLADDLKKAHDQNQNKSK
ncbi:hypothetical protein Tco_0073910 [Tanacetum coccineum]